MNLFEFVLRPCGRMVHRVDMGWHRAQGVRLDMVGYLPWFFVGDRISVRDVGVSLDPLKDRFGGLAKGCGHSGLHMGEILGEISSPLGFGFLIWAITDLDLGLTCGDQPVRSHQARTPRWDVAHGSKPPQIWNILEPSLFMVKYREFAKVASLEATSRRILVPAKKMRIPFLLHHRYHLYIFHVHIWPYLLGS